MERALRTVALSWCLLCSLAAGQDSALGAGPAPNAAPVAVAQGQFGSGFPGPHYFSPFFGGLGSLPGGGSLPGLPGGGNLPSLPGGGSLPSIPGIGSLFPGLGGGGGSTPAGGGTAGASAVVGPQFSSDAGVRAVNPQQVSFNLGLQQGQHPFGFGGYGVPGGGAAASGSVGGGGSADSPAVNVAQPPAGGVVGFYGAAPSFGSSGGLVSGFPGQFGAVGSEGAGNAGQFTAPQPLPLAVNNHLPQFPPFAGGGSFRGFSGPRQGAGGASLTEASGTQTGSSTSPGRSVKQPTVTSIQDEINKA